MKLKIPGLILLSTILLVAFQNCSDVQFSNVDSLNQKLGADTTVPEFVDMLEEENQIPEPDDQIPVTNNDGGDGQEVVNNDSNDKEEQVNNENDKEHQQQDPKNNEPEITVDDIIAEHACGNEDGEPGVLVCHHPPGNPAAKHTICIGERALEAHLHHERDENGEDHDHVGPCQ